MNRKRMMTAALLVALAVCMAGFSSCKKDDPEPEDPKAYIVDGQNYGQGIVVGNLVWAPVNCGYDKDHPNGKLYQWGRKDGFGVKGSSDEPQLSDDPVTPANALPNYYYLRWDGADKSLWAPSGSGNPCPKGWRVPTKNEFRPLAQLAAAGEWAKENEAWRYKVPVGDETLILHAGGWWRGGGNSDYSTGGKEVSLWASTEAAGGKFENLYINNEGIYLDDPMQASFAGSVRCVKENK